MTSDAVFAAASDAVSKCLSGNGEVAPARSREFFNYVADEVLSALERESHCLCPSQGCPASFEAEPFTAERQLINHWLACHHGSAS